MKLFLKIWRSMFGKNELQEFTETLSKEKQWLYNRGTLQMFIEALSNEEYERFKEVTGAKVETIILDKDEKPDPNYAKLTPRKKGPVRIWNKRPPVPWGQKHRFPSPSSTEQEDLKREYSWVEWVEDKKERMVWGDYHITYSDHFLKSFRCYFKGRLIGSGRTDVYAEFICYKHHKKNNEEL